MAALLHHHLGDGAVLGGEDLVFHLHGLQHHQQLALLDGGTLGHLHPEDGAGHGGVHRLARGDGGGGGRGGGGRGSRGGGGGRSGRGGGRGGVSLVLVRQHGLARLHLHLVGAAVQGHFIFHFT